MTKKQIAAHISEPIVRLIVSHVLFLCCGALLVMYAQFHAEHYYQAPARAAIVNQDNKHKLAHVVIRELYEVEVGYQRLLLFDNPRRIQVMATRLEAPLARINAILAVLERGGTFVDRQLSNFYNNDEIVETIHYSRENDHDLHVEFIDLPPQLATLEDFFLQTTTLLLNNNQKRSRDNQGHNFELIQTIKQTEALLLRVRESANYIFFDIRQTNLRSQRQIEQTQARAERVVFAISVATLFLVVLFAIIIAQRIFKILKNQKELQARNDWLSTVVDQSPSSIVITDTNGTIEYVNNFFENQTGYSRAEAIGNSTRILKSGETPDAVFTQMWETITQGGVWRGELCNKTKNGQLVYEEAVISPVVTAHGRIVNFAAIKLDITDKKKLARQHEQLQFEQERLKAILDKAPVGVVMTGDDCDILWANSFAQTLSGNQHLNGTSARQLFCGEAPGSVSGAVPSEYSRCVEHFLCTCAGRKIPIFRCSQRLNWCNQEVTLTTFVDLSNQKHLEAELSQKRKLESVGSLAAGVAHEINTPIQFIGHNLQFLRETIAEVFATLEPATNVVTFEAGAMAPAANGTIDDNSSTLDLLRTEIDSAISDSIQGVNNVAAIVRTLKEFSHPGVAVRTEIDINRLIDNTVAVSKNEWKYAAALTCHLDSQLPPISALPSELQQVFLNLIINARDAIAERQRLEPQHVGQITVRSGKSEPWLEIYLTDNGTGMSSDIVEKVFDPFFTTKPVGEGSGQGLSITRNIIVDKHRGQISVESSPGVGSTFRIRLPLLHCSAGS